MDLWSISMLNTQTWMAYSVWYSAWGVMLGDLMVPFQGINIANCHRSSKKVSTCEARLRTANSKPNWGMSIQTVRFLHPALRLKICIKSPTFRHIIPHTSCRNIICHSITFHKVVFRIYWTSYFILQTGLHLILRIRQHQVLGVEQAPVVVLVVAVDGNTTSTQSPWGRWQPRSCSRSRRSREWRCSPRGCRSKGSTPQSQLLHMLFGHVWPCPWA